VGCANSIEVLRVRKSGQLRRFPISLTCSEIEFANPTGVHLTSSPTPVNVLTQLLSSSDETTEMLPLTCTSAASELDGACRSSAKVRQPRTADMDADDLYFAVWPAESSLTTHARANITSVR